MRRVAALSLMVVIGTSCDPSGPNSGRRSIGPLASAEGSAAAPDAVDSSTADRTGAVGSIASSFVAAPTPAELVGPWEGVADAKRVPVALPATTPWPAWKKDDGKQSGPVSFTVVVDHTGEVRGKATGVLGALNVIGRLEGRMLRAAVSPVDPVADDAMTGTLLGKVDGERIAARLNASNRTGYKVRGATFELKRSATPPSK